jgi:hypothetical protein
MGNLFRRFPIDREGPPLWEVVPPDQSGNYELGMSPCRIKTASNGIDVKKFVENFTEF